MGGTIKKWIILFLLLFPTSTAFANPKINPIDLLPYVIVLGSAIGVEVGITAILLLFFNMSPVPVFATLFIGNLTIYFVFFLPLLDIISSLFIVEVIIVALDGALIKLISQFDAFQLETFTMLKWKYAFIVAAVGDIISYYVGAVMN